MINSITNGVEIYMTNDDSGIKVEDETESTDWRAETASKINGSIYNHATNYGYAGISAGVLTGGGGGGGGYGGLTAVIGQTPTLWTNSTINTSPWFSQTPIITKINGDATIDGELTIKGVKLSERLDKIEERLGILRPNDVLEERWNELKELGNRYRELEKELNEKEEIWNLLKK